MVRVGVFSWVEARARAKVAALTIAAIAATATAVDVVAAIAAVASAGEACTVVAAVDRATSAGSGCTVSYRGRDNSSSTIISIGSDTMVFMVAC